MGQAGSEHGFEVDPWVHGLGALVERWPRFWRGLGNLETRLLHERLAQVPITAPIYVTGLARSGSTLLLEILNWHPQTVSHRYRDFPLLYTPYLWNRFLDRVPRPRQAPAERAHRDGIWVTADSPEAFEEVLWMTSFPALHDPTRSAVLDAQTSNPSFEAFYRDHLRKLLLLRGAGRYLSKANYNITRLEYLLHLFPDARFVIPLRDPVWHIASLMKQQQLFCRGEENDPRVRVHLRRAGHFEFGLDRRPINADDSSCIADVQALWQTGREVEGWARYWHHLHSWLAQCLACNEALRKAALVVRYDTLCRQPREMLSLLLRHCGLEPTPELFARVEQRVRFPDYYQPCFTPDEVALIEAITVDARQDLERYALL